MCDFWNDFTTSRATHLWRTYNISTNTWKHFPWAKNEKKKMLWRTKLFVLHSNSLMQHVKPLIMGTMGQINATDLICLVKLAFKTFSIWKDSQWGYTFSLHILHPFLCRFALQIHPIYIACLCRPLKSEIPL